MLIEDQRRERKQQRADTAAAVVDEDVIEGKLKAALAVRRDRETLVIGRTDAFGALGLDAALRRGERFLRVGVDGVFVAGLRRPEDYERVGRALGGAMLSAALFEDAVTPLISPAELGAMGFRHVSFPVTVIFRAVAAMRSGLAELRQYADGRRRLEPLPDASDVRMALDEAVGLARWRGIDASFAREASQ